VCILIDLYWDQGLTLKEIGEKLGVSFRTVYRRMMEADVPRRNLGSRPAHGDQPHRPAEVLTPKFLTNAYVRKRMRMKQIAEQTGFSVESARRYLSTSGIRSARLVTRSRKDSWRS
jgi:predicted DNA-binding transcriptional regulator AlpA